MSAGLRCEGAKEIAVKNPLVWLLFVVIAAGAFVAGHYFSREPAEGVARAPEPAPEPPVTMAVPPPIIMSQPAPTTAPPEGEKEESREGPATSEPKPAGAPIALHPIEPPKTGWPPLTLDGSDPTLLGALISLLGRRTVDELVRSTGIVRRIVATVDDLPRQKAPQNAWPVRASAGLIVTSGREDTLAIDVGKNSVRYTAFVRAVERINVQQLVSTYVRFYPLFQHAYRESGDRGYFNDRLVASIDHLLATPSVEGPLKLTKRKILYEFDDPALEARSAGQKLLIRMGPENSRAIKMKLRELRQALVSPASGLAP